MVIEPGPALEFLKSIPIFGGLEGAALERIIGMLEESAFPEGAIVCQQGDVGRTMYIVRSGEVVLSRIGESGVPVRVVRLGPGEFFGETTLLEIHARSSTAVVDAPATIYVLSNSGFYKLYREDIQAYVMVITNICRELSRRLRKAEDRICELAEAAGDPRTQIGRTGSIQLPWTGPGR